MCCVNRLGWTNKCSITALTCHLGHHQFGFAPGSISLGGVRCHRDGVSGVRLESSNDHFLRGNREETGDEGGKCQSVKLKLQLLNPRFMLKILHLTYSFMWNVSLSSLILTRHALNVRCFLPVQRESIPLSKSSELARWRGMQMRGSTPLLPRFFSNFPGNNFALWCMHAECILGIHWQFLPRPLSFLACSSKRSFRSILMNLSGEKVWTHVEWGF